MISIARFVEQTLDTYPATLEPKGRPKFLTLSVLVEGTPHSADYCSLFARKDRIDAIKEGKTWKTNRQVIERYLSEKG